MTRRQDDIKRGPTDYMAEAVNAYIRENAELRAEIERLRTALAEYDELRRLAADPRISSELIGMRVRNTLANEQKSSEPPDGLLWLTKMRIRQ